MSKPRLDALASPLLLGCVAVLVVNDRVLKVAFHNAVTGKLSDVAGVAAFALFWAALFPRRRRAAFVMTAMGFAWWKSPASQPVIDAWNANVGWTVGRVVDWTDLLALAVLPLIYRSHPRPAAHPWLRRVPGPVVAAACVLAFAATSRIHSVSYPEEAPYALDLPRDVVLQRMYDLRAGFAPFAIPPGIGADGKRDTLHVFVGVKERYGMRHVSVLLEIAPSEKGGTLLRPVEAWSSGTPFSAADARRALEEQVIEPVRRNRPNTIHHEPPVVGNRPRMAPRILGPRELYASRGRVHVEIGEDAYLALVEITPRMDWEVIYPVSPQGERLHEAGNYLLGTRCAGVAPSGEPPGTEVPACGVARRMTADEAREMMGDLVPNPCPSGSNNPVPRVRPGTLLLIAADAPMPLAQLEATLGTWCRPFPTLYREELGRVLRRMGVRRWAAVEADLRR